MKRNSRRRELAVNLLGELFGSFLIAVGVYNFAVMAEFPLTGFTGISLIFYRLFGVPIGLTTILLNIPVAFLCFRLLGRTFFLRSVRCTLFSSLMVDLVAPLLPLYHGERLLAALCASVSLGLGFAVIYMQNSSTGGMDFIILSVKKLRPHLSIGRTTFLTDVGIVIVGGAVFGDADGVIYGMIITFIQATVVDKVMYGINAGKMTFIVTGDGANISRVIGETCGRGSTILRGVGGYRQDQRDVVLCACNNKQMYQVLRAVQAADEGAFMSVLESSEVHGEGFRRMGVGG